MAKLKKTESTTAHWQECRAARSHLPASVGCELAGYPESNLAGSRQAEGWPARTGIAPHVGRRDIHARGQQRLETIQMPINWRPHYTTEKVNQHWPRTALQQVLTTVLSGKKASRRKTNAVWFPSREFNTNKTDTKKWSMQYSFSGRCFKCWGYSSEHFALRFSVTVKWQRK